MADEKMPDGSPQSMAIASAAILTALLDELVHNQTMARDDVVRIISAARARVGRTGTLGAYAEARSYLGLLQERFEP